MDPNETLRQIRDGIEVARIAADEDSNDAEIQAWQEVGELFDALDAWLSGGGFHPGDWWGTAE